MEGAFSVEEIIAAAPGPMISIDEAIKLCGGLWQKKTFYNICSLGEGPPKIRLGRKIGFKTEDFAAWLVTRIEKCEAP